MRIAFTLLSGIGYGGMTYFRNLLPAIAAVDARNEYHCFVQAQHPLVAELHRPNIVFHETVRSQTNALERFRYEQFVLPGELRRFRIDLLYTAKNIAVFRAPCPQVIAIRNMEPFRYREFENARVLDVQSRMKWELTKRSIRLASGIVAVSNAVRDVVVERFPDAASKVRVVYNGNPVPQSVSLDGVGGAARIGCVERFRQDDNDTVERYKQRNRKRSTEKGPGPFLLTASKFVAYANQLSLVEGYARSLQERPDAPPLWFAGGVHDQRYFDRVRARIAALGIHDHIRFLGLVPQNELHNLMRQATAFVFPSMLESCPHALLEAMACGVPIATSNTPPMPELCGDAAAYFDPRNPDAIATAIARLLDDAALRDRLAAAGHERVKEFTWERTARGLMEVFEHIASPYVISSGAKRSREISQHGDDVAVM